MSNQIEEKISSLLDDELAPADREQLIKQLKQSNTHQQMLGRYCLIQEAMKKNLHSDPKHNLFSRVSTALESEPVLFAPSTDAIPESNTPSDAQVTPQKEAVVGGFFNKPTYGWAAAAAIAMVAVVSSVNISGTQEPELGAMDLVSKQETQQLVVPVMSSQANAPVLVTSSPAPTVQVPQVMPSEDQWERIDQNNGIAWEVYLKEHSETASQSGVQPSVAPMARIVSFEGDGQKQ